MEVKKNLSLIRLRIISLFNKKLYMEQWGDELFLIQSGHVEKWKVLPRCFNL